MSQLVQYRRDLHQIPELDFDLPQTLAYVRGRLTHLGERVAVTEPAPSTICAYVDNGAPTTIAFRADMDGLPVTESAARAWRSTHEGQMHACGHDGHMAMLLALCDHVAAQGAPHNILAIFQPAEETTGGAKLICDSGVLERYSVNAVFGLHMWPGFAAGQIVSRRAELMARCSEVKIHVRGRSVHIAKADEGADALYAATQFVGRVYAMVSELESGGQRLLKFGLLRSGTVCNIIAGDAVLEGSMRAFSDDTYEAMRSGLLAAASDVSAETGCEFDIDIDLGYPPVINDGALFDAVRAQVSTPITLLPEAPMTGEDFSFYQHVVPGVFFFVGTGQDDALHSTGFDFDEAALAGGLDLLKQLAGLKLPFPELPEQE